MQRLTRGITRDDQDAKDGNTARQIEQLGLTAFRQPSRDAFSHVVEANFLPRLKVCPGATAQGVGTLQLGALDKAGGKVRRDQFNGFTVLHDKEPTHENLGTLRQPQHGGDARGNRDLPDLDQPPRGLRLVTRERFTPRRSLCSTTAGRPRTIVPYPCRDSTQPSRFSNSSARTTVGRDIPNACTS